MKEKWLTRCDNQLRADQRFEIAMQQEEKVRKEQMTEETRHIVAR